VKQQEKRTPRNAGLREQIRQNRFAFAVRLVLCIIVIGVGIRNAMQGQWESVLTCILTLILFLAPDLIERQLHIKLPTAMEVTVFVFIFCAEILGEIACFYIKYSFWDTTLHTVNGFLFAAFGFCLVDLLNENQRIKLQLSPIFLAVVSFCFSMTIGILWEFFEFSVDHTLMKDMQKDTVLTGFQSVMLDETQRNIPVAVKDITRTTIETPDETYIIEGYLDIGLTDTMKDLFVNFIGATVFSCIGYAYVRRRGKHGLAAAFIPVVEPAEEQTNGIQSESDETQEDS